MTGSGQTVSEWWDHNFQVLRRFDCFAFEATSLSKPRRAGSGLAAEEMLTGCKGCWMFTDSIAAHQDFELRPTVRQEGPGIGVAVVSSAQFPISYSAP